MGLIKTCFLTSVIIYHKCATLCGNTEHFTTDDGFTSKCLLIIIILIVSYCGVFLQTRGPISQTQS